MNRATLSAFEFPCDRCCRVRFLDTETNLCTDVQGEDGKPLYKATCHEASLVYRFLDENRWRKFFALRLGALDDYDDEAA